MYEAASAVSPPPPKGDTSRVILHFDYDCFYCSVFEAQEPALKSLPFAVQQKQIIVTCNYEARRRGLYKLQLVTDAKRACPDLVIRLGEDLDPFRAASKRCFQHLASFAWSGRAERLGFDEVWLDVSDMVAFNAPLMDGANSFFRLDPLDATKGFAYDASTYAGFTYPENEMPRVLAEGDIDPFTASAREAEARLLLGSHLARYLRGQLEEQLHFTATVGISVNKVLSKLVGNCHKPNGQTTLVPPYFASSDAGSDHVQAFMDGHDIGKVPGIGFKSAQALRSAVLGRAAQIEGGLVYGWTKEDIRVVDVRTRLHGPDAIRRVLSGPGAAKDIGQHVWALVHGIEDSAVARASTIPTQISLEDSYLQLEGWSEIRAQLSLLSTRLVRRLRLELYDVPSCQWLAHAHTLRLTTRPRPPRGPDGFRSRSMKRISRSAPMPAFVFAAPCSDQDVPAIADRLVTAHFTPMFRALHPRTAGLDLSLVNVAATHIVALRERAKDIGSMFRAATKVKDGVEEEEEEEEERKEEEVGYSGGLAPEVVHNRYGRRPEPGEALELRGSEDAWISQESIEEGWNEDEDTMTADEYEASIPLHVCAVCGAHMPPFAWEAHARYHEEEEEVEVGMNMDVNAEAEA